ncbi:MAG TPA: RICIN domain-containing protein [Actinospica sp.]|nr:RICIN domain-containing protein [Actinospica sp.]
MGARSRALHAGRRPRRRRPRAGPRHRAPSSSPDGRAATPPRPPRGSLQRPDGYFKIYNVASGEVLGVQNQSTANGAAILQWSDNGTLHHE